MAKYQRFEELPAWVEAKRLYNLVLDLVAKHPILTSAFRNQLDRAAMSVSNNIAEGFERVTTHELISFLAIARGSAGEVRSMICVVQDRKELSHVNGKLEEIRSCSEICGRQIGAWISSIETSEVQGKRHLTKDAKFKREASHTTDKYRQRFLRNLPPNHPLYNTDEARRARQQSPA